VASSPRSKSESHNAGESSKKARGLDWGAELGLKTSCRVQRKKSVQEKSKRATREEGGGRTKKSSSRCQKAYQKFLIVHTKRRESTISDMRRKEKTLGKVGGHKELKIRTEPNGLDRLFASEPDRREPGFPRLEGRRGKMVN